MRICGFFYNWLEARVIDLICDYRASIAKQSVKKKTTTVSAGEMWSIYEKNIYINIISITEMRPTDGIRPVWYRHYWYFNLNNL